MERLLLLRGAHCHPSRPIVAAAQLCVPLCRVALVYIYYVMFLYTDREREREREREERERERERERDA
jgi:hypothetical protein